MSSDVLELDGTVTHYTDAVKKRQQQTVSMWTGVGWSGGSFSAQVMPDLFFVSGTSLPSADGYSCLCEWIAKLLGRSLLRAERAAVCAKNLHKDITSSLRDGGSVASAALVRLTSHQLLPQDGTPHSRRGPTVHSAASTADAAPSSSKRKGGKGSKAPKGASICLSSPSAPGTPPPLPLLVSSCSSCSSTPPRACKRLLLPSMIEGDRWSTRARACLCFLSLPGCVSGCLHANLTCLVVRRPS